MEPTVVVHGPKMQVGVARPRPNQDVKQMEDAIWQMVLEGEIEPEEC